MLSASIVYTSRFLTVQTLSRAYELAERQKRRTFQYVQAHPVNIDLHREDPLNRICLPKSTAATNCRRNPLLLITMTYNSKARRLFAICFRFAKSKLEMLQLLRELAAHQAANRCHDSDGGPAPGTVCTGPAADPSIPITPPQVLRALGCRARAHSQRGSRSDVVAGGLVRRRDMNIQLSPPPSDSPACHRLT